MINEALAKVYEAPVFAYVDEVQQHPEKKCWSRFSKYHPSYQNWTTLQLSEIDYRC